MRAPVHASADDIDLAALWAALVRSLPRLVVLSIALGVLAYAVLSLAAPRYESEAQLAIVAKGTPNPFADPARAGPAPDSVAVRMDKEAVNTHVRALMSPDLAARIAAELKLAEKVEFNSALGSPDALSALFAMVGIGAPRPSESDQDRVLAAFFRRLEVYSPKESRFIGVRFSSIDPDLAAEVANRIAETYRESLASQTVVETDEVQHALEPKIAKLSEEVAAAEAEVERFRGEANLFKAGQQSTGLNEQQLGELTAELTKVKAARSEAEARTKSAREMQRLGGAETLPDVQKSPLIQNLVQQRVRVERQMAELSATLLPAHPRMRQLAADLAGLKGQIDAEVAKIVDGLAKEAKVAALREEAITRSLNEVKTRIVSTGPNEAKLRSLEAVVKSKRAELDRLQSQYEANRLRADSRTVPVEAQIVTRARPSSRPSFPKKLPFALLFAAATLLLGTAFRVTRGLLFGQWRALPARGSLSKVERELPSLSPGPMPEPRAAARDAEDARAPARVARVGTPAEIASCLGALKSPGTGGVRTLVTGEVESITVWEEAAALAEELAAAATAVVLVDWSPEGRGISRMLGRPSDPGMNDLLRGSARFEDVIGRLPESAVHFIPAGGALPEPSETLEADRINVVLDALDEVYDHIVVAARREAARALFELIQGRFDAGLTVAEARQRQGAVENPLETFLGYEVEGVALLYYERPARSPARVGERLRSAAHEARHV
jgi:uncharacterized protein involved in exopolysaccharide biosynthesis